MFSRNVTSWASLHFVRWHLALGCISSPLSVQECKMCLQKKEIFAVKSSFALPWPCQALDLCSPSLAVASRAVLTLTSPLASHCLLLSTGMWLKEPSQPNSLAQDPCLPSSLLPLYSHFLCPSISHPYRAVLSSSLPIHPPCSFLLWGPLSMLSPELPLLASLFPSNCSFPQCLLLFFLSLLVYSLKF